MNTMNDFTDFELGFLVGCMMSIQLSPICDKKEKDVAKTIEQKLKLVLINRKNAN